MDYTKAAEDFFSCMKQKDAKKVLLKLNENSQGEPLVLVYLYKNAGALIVPSDIAKYIGTSTARVASILNSLEGKGMISREISREDRRKILVFLTDKGRRETKERRTRIITRISNVFKAMGEERTQQFIEDWALFLKMSLSILEQEKEEH
ncbi:MarR family winged helix-turn-helix transcriptional regulator [Lactococcus hircilactis]|nr:MarR family transcriptional regulator [Lactococcus hircilactis]